MELAPVEGVAAEEAVEVVALGEVRAKVGERSTHSLMLRMDVFHRKNLKAKVEDPLGCMQVIDVRGAGACAEVIVAVDARRSGDAEFSVRVAGWEMTVWGKGRLVVVPADPLVVKMTAVFGGTASTTIPLEEELWVAKPFTVHFEPKHKEFTVSCNKGEIPAGAKIMPFRVFYRPRDSTPVETMLLVDCGEFEVAARLCGTPCGFGGRRWGRA
jgi:hypothetical protein